MEVNNLYSVRFAIDNFYTKEQLISAQHLAEKALHGNSNDIHNSQWALLTLGEIQNKKGRYSGDEAFFHEALTYFNQGLAAENLKRELEVDFLISLGKTYRYLEQCPKAIEYLNKALVYSRRLPYVKGIHRSLVELSKVYVIKSNFKQALEYAQECLEFIEIQKIRDPNLLANCYNQIGQVYVKKQAYSDIGSYFEEALSLSLKAGNKEAIIAAYNNLGIIHAVNGAFKKAINYFINALDYSKIINYRFHIANSLINIGTIYAYLHNHDEALKRYIKVVDIYSDVLDSHGTIIVLNNIGNINFNKENFKAAYTYFRQSLQLAKESDYTEMIAHSKAQLSRSLIAQGQFEEAYAYALAAKELFSQLGNINNGGQHITFTILGKIYFRLRQYSKAIDCTLKGIGLAKKQTGNHPYLIEGYKLLTDIYQTNEDFKQALYYHRLYADTQERLHKDLQARHVIDREIQYDLKEKEKAIKQLQKENRYQALLLEKSKEIEQRNLQLTQANEELKQFAYVVSHDLKEPLRMIGSYSQLVAKYYEPQFDEMGKEFMAYIHEGATRMSNLLNDLLEYATVGRKEQQKQIVSVDLNYILEEVQENLMIKIQENNATIQTQKLPVLHSIPSLFLQLFQNLISNAIKFRKNIPPLVKIGVKEEKDHFEFSVQDNGIGIAPEFKERIFSIFQRLHSRKKYEGTGIGLSICQKIVQQAFGGKIWITSEEGKGTTFYFTHPKKLALQ